MKLSPTAYREIKQVEIKIRQQDDLKPIKIDKKTTIMAKSHRSESEVIDGWYGRINRVQQ